MDVEGSSHSQHQLGINFGDELGDEAFMLGRAQPRPEQIRLEVGDTFNQFTFYSLV